MTERALACAVPERLSDHQVVLAWDWGRDKHPVDRTIGILHLSTGATRQALCTLPLGQRDTLLLRTRAQVLGPALNIVVDCPTCGETLEFAHDVHTLTVATPATLEPGLHRIELHNLVAWFRLPDSTDDAALAVELRGRDPRRFVLRRCLQRLQTQDGREVPLSPPDDPFQPDPFDSVPAELLDALVTAMGKADPLSEIRFRLSCPACAHDWSSLLDVQTFVWEELARRAQRLMHEVHLLAAAYHWPETTILQMGAARRHLYLEMVGHV